MDNPKMEDFGSFARSHKLAKRAIVRGLYYPYTNRISRFKERPQLIISDMDECPGNWNSIGIITVPLFSNPHSDFDIPMMTDNYKKGERKISFIRTADQLQWESNTQMCNDVYASTVCPDRIFDLVIKVKKLILKADKESYTKAREMVKEHRVEFMNFYKIPKIYYLLEPEYMYVLHSTGEEEIVDLSKTAMGCYSDDLVEEFVDTDEESIDSEIVKETLVIEAGEDIPYIGPEEPEESHELVEEQIEEVHEEIPVPVEDSVEKQVGIQTEDKTVDENTVSTFVIPEPKGPHPEMEKDMMKVNKKFNSNMDTTNLRYSKSGLEEIEEEPQSIYGNYNRGFINPMADALMRASSNTATIKQEKKNKEIPVKVVVIDKPVVEEPVKIEEKKPAKRRMTRVSQSTDEELLKFIALINNCGTCLEVALKMDVTPTSVSNRFKQTMKELERRGMSDKIIEWPFARGCR